MYFLFDYSIVPIHRWICYICLLAILTTQPNNAPANSPTSQTSPPVKHFDLRKLPWTMARKIVARIKTPQFPARIFPVTRFGAVGNGTTDDTRAFSQTIAACASAGGGNVVVPPGTYLTGAVELRSGVNFHVSRGATLLFSSHAREFPMRLTRNQGIDLMNFSPLIYAHHQTNIALTGHGTLNGILTARWNRQNSRSWHRLETMRDMSVPIPDRIFGTKHPLGTAFVEFHNCRNVLISGIHIVHSQWWEIHPTLCTNVTIVHVATHSTHGNSDGCDLDSCRDVLINHCFFSAGDDCVSLKSGRDPDKFRSKRPCQDIVIANSRFSGPWGLISCGSEESQGIENVFGWHLQAVRSGRFRGVRYALYVKANSMRGGYVHNVHLADISGTCTRSLLHITLVFGPHHGRNYPDFSGFYFRSIHALQTPQVLFLVGIRHDAIGRVTLRHCTFHGIVHKNSIKDAPHVIYENVHVH